MGKRQYPAAFVTCKAFTMAPKPSAKFDPETFLKAANWSKSASAYEKGKVIFSQGSPADAVFYINEGEVKLTVVSERGKEAVIAILGSRDFFGEGSLAGQSMRMATATTMSDCMMTRIGKADMIRTLHDQVEFSEKFLAYVLGRNARIEADLVDQLFNSSEKRLARLLLLLANFGGEGKPEPVLAQISQETLAEMVGTTRSRVSFFMNKFRRLGLIGYNGKIEIKTALLNMVLHDNPKISAETDQD